LAKSDATALIANLQPAIFPLGDRGLVVQFDDCIDDGVFERVQTLSRALAGTSIAGVIEHVPAYTTVTVYYDPQQASFHAVGGAVRQLLTREGEFKVSAARTVAIPVCYGGAFGVDVEHVAEHSGLTVDEVIAIHSGATYRVHMLGFAPGFPYLGGMSQRIATPRRASPRLKVPAGSVGIAGEQTGIYSLETPGGWQIIGRTPLALFQPTDNPPTLLAAGDIVRFRPITQEEFIALQEAA
jgi:inhibitor of KinA